MILLKIWETATNVGLKYHVGERDKFRVKLFNQLIFIALCASTAMFILQLIIFGKQAVPSLTLSNIALEIFLLSLSHFGRVNIALHLTFLIFPLRSVVVSALSGGNTGESSVLMAMGFCSLIFYEGRKKLQISTVIYMSCLYAGFKFYMQNKNGLGNKLVYFEIITFLLVLITMYIIVALYQNQIKKYEQNNLQLIKDLEQKNEELEQFTYIASHDLKTPLRNVSSHLDLIQRYITQEKFDKIDVSINFAKKGVKQMYALLNDILEFKNIASQANDNEYTDLKNVMMRLENGFQHRVTLTFDKLPTLKMKEYEADILFQNMIRNGVIYNKSLNPKVDIKYEIIDSTIKISILDNGIGIDKKYHELIFHFFKRLHNSDDYEGTGIGLGLCRKIVRSHGGDITVISPLPQGGSCFVITLPISLIKKPL